MAIKSKLATSSLQAAKGNYSVGRSGKKICKITIHHAVMTKASASQIAKVFANPKRRASANYCVGYKLGDICCSLYEENRAWTSSNRDNDQQAITMEVANSSVKYPYPVSNDTLENIINLCVDICKRYNFKLTWTGDKKGSLTVHRMFAATACPGDYLMSKMPYIAEEVNRRLKDDSKNTNWTSGKYKVLVSKYLRKDHNLTNNYVKVKECTSAMKNALTSKKSNDKAKIQVGRIITILDVYIEKNGRVWGKNYSGWVVLCNVDGTPQFEKRS